MEKKKIKIQRNIFKLKLENSIKYIPLINKKQEFSILLTNKSKMKNLNYKFRKK